MLGNWMQSSLIQRKIGAVMAVLGLVGLTVAGMNARSMQQIDAKYEHLVDNVLPATAHLVRAHRQGTEATMGAYRLLVYPAGSPEAAEATRSMKLAMDGAKQSFATAIRIDPDLSLELGDLNREFDEIYNSAVRVVELSQAGQRDAAFRQVKMTQGDLDRFGADLKKFNEARVQKTTQIADELGESTNAASIMALVMSVLGFGLAVGGALWLVRRSVVQPLNAIERRMRDLAGGDSKSEVPGVARKDELGQMARALEVFREAAIQRDRMEQEKMQADAAQAKVVATVGRHLDLLASGDLTASIRDDFPGSYDQLKGSFNAALASLGTLIRQVAQSAGEIRTGSSEIAQASEDLARRTEGNAASLEETSAAIAQMDERLKASAGAATKTVGRADQAIATVTGGRALADEAVAAMGRVSDSAKGIDGVIEGLDKIAFQTRVLAMNAAVEAGRAGEAGRGFAVVADLVSALAMRAEEEAKRARDQLTVTQTDIVTAVEAVGQVDAALQNISADVGEVHALLGSMASDNQAQALAITEINSAIASMDQSTQQNAAMVEETSAAARNLLSEVNGLAEQAGQFRCEGGARRAAPAMPRRGKEGAYQSPVKPLPAAAIEALRRPGSDDDWKEF